MRKKTKKLQYLMVWNDMALRKRLNTEYARSVLRCSVSEALIDCDDLFHKTSDKGRVLVRIINE